jgi:hypothetical protein
MSTARTRAFGGNEGPLRAHLVRARAGRRERLVVVVGAACASAGSEHGVVRGAGNCIKAEGAAALAAALQGNTTLQTLYFHCTWIALSLASMGGRSGDLASARVERRERLVFVVGAACASAGSEHGVVRGAGNCIKAEGAAALAAALQGNTTLQKLNIASTQIARKPVSGEHERPRGDLGRARAERRERLADAVGAACASLGSEHGKVRGAGNAIQAEGAVALAAALKGNTTLRKLNLNCMCIACKSASCGI